MGENLYDPRELIVGMYVEMEHTDSRSIAKLVALDHLRENPTYYSELISSGLVEEPEALNMYKSLFENTTLKAALKFKNAHFNRIDALRVIATGKFGIVEGISPIMANNILNMINTKGSEFESSISKMNPAQLKEYYNGVCKRIEESRLLKEEIESATDLIPKIEAAIKKHFPKSFMNITFQGKGWNVISVVFAVGNKSDWYNGIYNNDVADYRFYVERGFDNDGNIIRPLTLDSNHQGGFVVLPDPNGPEKHYAYSRIKVPFRSIKNTTPEKIVKAIDVHFGRLKVALKDNLDRLGSSHQYVKNYV